MAKADKKPTVSDEAAVTAEPADAATDEATTSATEKATDKAAVKAKTAGKSKRVDKAKAAGQKVSDQAEASAKAVKPARPKKTKPAKIDGANPSWWVPVMVGLMVVGVLWLVVFYLSNQKAPIPAMHAWNMAVGFVMIMAGFVMTTRWK